MAGFLSPTRFVKEQLLTFVFKIMIKSEVLDSSSKVSSLGIGTDERPFVWCFTDSPIPGGGAPRGSGICRKGAAAPGVLRARALLTEVD